MFYMNRMVKLKGIINLSSINIINKSRYCEKNLSTHLDIKEKPHFIGKERFGELKQQISDSDYQKSISSDFEYCGNKLKPDQVFEILSDLSLLHKEKRFDFQIIKNCSNYDNFVSTIDRHGSNRSIKQIVSALKDLDELCLDRMDFLVQSLITDVLWNIRKVSISHLLFILNSNLNFECSPRHKKLYAETVTALQHRYSEVTQGKDFCLIYQMYNKFSSSYIGQIDNRIIEYVSFMPLNSLIDILISLSTVKRRPTSVLRALSMYIFKSNETLTPKQISNVVLAMKSLNYYEESVLEKLATDFVMQKSEIRHLHWKTVVSCMGQMKWRNVSLIDTLSEWLVINKDSLKKSLSQADIASFLLTIGTISVVPHNIDEILELFLPASYKQTTKLSQSQWVDVVWALCIIEKVKSSQILSVLNSSFIDTIPQNDILCVGIWLKLLNINAYAYYISEHHSPKLKLETLNPLFTTRSRKDITLQQFVLNVIKNIFPPPKYLIENIQTDLGFTIDAEFLVDKFAKPLCLSDYNSESNTVKKSDNFENEQKKDLAKRFSNFNEVSLKSLPEGSFRMALVIWNFKSYTIGSRVLSGQNSLILQLLKKKGYCVVEIPFYEINLKDKLVRSSKYFEQKIISAIEKFQDAKA